MNARVVVLPVAAGAAVLALSAAAPAAGWSWQQPHAKVLPTGDLEWTPEPFRFVAGPSVRYIDFEGGDDANDGLSTARPWKRHPWDPAATGNAKGCRGAHTYVFKGGVVYRGTLLAAESGEPGNPIRLTRDPAWGAGEAVLSGAEVVRGWRRGAAHPDLPEPEKVWYADIEFSPRNLWTVAADGTVTRIPLARTPNWTVSDPDDVKSEWWQWDNPKTPWGETVPHGAIQSHRGIDTVHLTNAPSYYAGAFIWPEYGWVMGTPYPTRILAFQPENRALVFGGQWSDQAGKYHVPRHARYYLEDKPHYLDAAGEFWFERKAPPPAAEGAAAPRPEDVGGRLYLRAPGDADPNALRVEAGRRLNVIDSEAISHVEVSGLSFRFVNTYWDIDAPPMRHRDVDPACIRLLGSGRGIVVANCLFEHVHLPVRMKALGEQGAIDGVVLRDNDVRWTDHGVFSLADGGSWGVEMPQGRLHDVKVLRNRMFQVGLRPTRFGQGHAIEVECAETAEIAGNVGERLYGSGIFVFGGKRSGAKADRPLTRILIHHNRIVDPMLNNNDWGGIETWQGGPAYVFDNVSGNPGGFKLWGLKLHAGKPANARFGHAYYMDGGFKQYFFNNIAWGKSRDPLGALGNCSAFQEIHGFFASVFNNTVYNFVIGSRRQAPAAGRNKYLGNVWQGLGDMVFRHADPKDRQADPNAADAAAKKSDFEHESNAYAANVFFETPKKLGVFEATGEWYGDLDSFRKALAARGSLGDVGVAAEAPPLRAPEKHDFRPAAPAVDRGARVFVPWGLRAVVGEWPFYPAGNDPTKLLDEHFHLAPYYADRTEYLRVPLYPLRAVNVGAGDFVDGPLEDWTRGALRLNGRDQYAVLTQADMAAKPRAVEVAIKNKESDWARFETPGKVTPGTPFQAKVSLLPGQVPAGMKLRADLHWVNNAGRFGGMNAFGGEAKPVQGEGPYVFSFKPVPKPSLGHFVVTAWYGPTGDWTNKVKTAQWSIAPGAAETAEAYRSPQVQDTSFLLEAFFRTEPGHAGGVLAEKMGKAGYSLAVGAGGTPVFSVRAGGAARELAGATKVNDGQWHHVVAEADRAAGTLALYVDGRRDAGGQGIGPGASLADACDLFVGGTPSGRCLAGTFEFLRIALGTLADAKTTIEELYAWQFDGPFLRDFAGRAPTGKRRDAGALESE